MPLQTPDTCSMRIRGTAAPPVQSDAPLLNGPVHRRPQVTVMEARDGAAAGDAAEQLRAPAAAGAVRSPGWDLAAHARGSDAADSAWALLARVRHAVLPWACSDHASVMAAH